MPRLTDHIYLSNYRNLRATWFSDPTSLFFLSALEQWALHDYFRFSEQLSEQALLEHRGGVGERDLSLPQRAGRALTRLRLMEQRLAAYRAAPKPPRKKGSAYKVRILSEVHPTIDVSKFAKILINYERRDP